MKLFLVSMDMNLMTLILVAPDGERQADTVLHGPCTLSAAGDNDCSANNGGCEQLCSNVAGGVRCSCYQGYRLVDNTRCQGKQAKIVGIINNYRQYLCDFVSRLVDN